MKKLLLLALLALAPTSAFAQCTGLFPPGTLCGNNTGSPKPAFPVPASSVTGPGTTVVNDLALWANTIGTSLKDSPPQALTGANDTNVTITLSGSPTTALVNPALITMGWTGVLAAARLNSNVVQAITNDTNVTGSITAQNLTLGWTGTLAAGRLNSSVVEAFTNDTNVTASITAQNATLGWTGQLAIARGGTGAATKAAAATAILPTPSLPGDIVYWNGSNWITLAGNSSGTQFLQETSSGVPSWATVSGTGTVTQLNLGAGIVSTVSANCSQTAITTTGTISSANCVNAQVGTTYAIVDGDRAKLVTATNAAAQAYTLAAAGAASQFSAGWWVDFNNFSSNPAGIVTITPTTSTICGASALQVYPGESLKITSDGTNYLCTYYTASVGPWHLINVLTASNSATLTDTTSITATFTEYEFVLEQILPASASVSVQFQVSVSGFQTSSYLSTALLGTGGSAGSNTLTSGVQVGVAAQIPNTAPGISGRYLLSNPAQTLTCKMLYGEYAVIVSGAIFTGTSAGCYNGGSGAITGVRLGATSGNLTSGVWKIYGRIK